MLAKFYEIKNRRICTNLWPFQFLQFFFICHSFLSLFFDKTPIDTIESNSCMGQQFSNCSLFRVYILNVNPHFYQGEAKKSFKNVSNSLLFLKFTEIGIFAEIYGQLINLVVTFLNLIQNILIERKKQNGHTWQWRILKQLVFYKNFQVPFHFSNLMNTFTNKFIYLFNQFFIHRQGHSTNL